jgi:tetratricopeptide (TPR) repeat protein
LLAYARVLRNTRRRQRALPVLAEAVAISRELSEGDALEYGGLLARALRELADYLTKYGQAGDALPLAEEAVALARISDGGALVVALYAYARVLRALGRHEEAAACEAEAEAVPGD